LTYLQMRDAWGINWSLVTGSELSADTYRASSHQLANAGRFLWLCAYGSW